MTELFAKDKHHLLDRFPKIELSYETIPHTKVSTDYNICIGIPAGTKGYAWFTFHGPADVCFFMEMNKERNFTKITEYPFVKHSPFTSGTLFYGTMVGPAEFVIEDVFYYQGVNIKSAFFSEKLGFLERFLQTYQKESQKIIFHLPQMWAIRKTESYDCLYDTPENLGDQSFHHIQYRCLKKTAPYLNVFPTKKGFAAITQSVIQPIFILPWRQANFSKPQYKQITIFKVMADIQFDIYRLFIYGANKTTIYYNVACIPNYKTSVMMNGIFRKIRENENLDAIEESEDEEDFENVDPEKYVDLKKWVFMECRFHPKFKKWLPVRIVDKEQKVAHISQL